MDVDHLALSRVAYNDSTHYLETSVRPQWIRSISSFNSVHAPGSKYHTAAYLSRSRAFRPKTRSSVRQQEAALVAAFFSTQDVVSITAEDSRDPMAVAGADIMMELMNYRLTGRSIPWFKILVGAFQDGQIYNTPIARVEWEFEEKDTGDDKLVGEDEFGSPVYERVKKITKDHPVIEVVAPENFRISPTCNWQDPINSSPYVIELIPMTVDEVKKEIESGIRGWKNIEISDLLTSQGEQSNDVTRAAREGTGQDRYDSVETTESYRPVWVHRNIMRIEGEDWQWYTVGTSKMLSDPVRLSDVILHGKRPYVMGCVVIEAHKINPASPIALGQELQASANELFNQRFDNIKLALNNRSLVRRAANVDLRNLKRSVPGGIVMVGDLERDVKPLITHDVTSTSYAEQDRINMDIDEILGTFSQSSIASNRKLGETVGGMSMVKDNVNTMIEYGIRTFSETFVEPVIRMLVDLEREYETDEAVIAIASDRAKIPEGIEVSRDILRHPIEVSIDVGYGATDPVRKIQKLQMAFNAISIIPGIQARINPEAVIKEVFGNAGYKNSERFFRAEEELASQQQGPPPEVQLEMEKVKILRDKTDAELRIAWQNMVDEREIAFSKLALEQKMSLDELYNKLGLEREKLALKRESQQLDVISEVSRQNEIENNRRELEFKERTGSQGI